MSARRTSLRGGAGLLGGAVLVALLAPLLASDRPILARVRGSICSPALPSYPLVGSILRCPADRTIDWGAGRQRENGHVLWSPPIPHGPYATDLDALYQPPSRIHPMGTDSLGRDVAARLVHGFPVALGVGGLATALALIVGILVGALAGAGGRLVDLALSRLMDLMACFPALILALVLVAVADQPGPGTLVAAIAVTRWTGIGRFFRAEVLRQRELIYCEAARAAGARAAYLVTRHILPNALAPILVTAAFSVSSAVLLEAGMSFLGLGVPPPAPSWGAILAEAWRQVVPSWWLVLFPSLALFLTVLGCNLIAEGYRDSTDPRISRI